MQLINGMTKMTAEVLVAASLATSSPPCSLSMQPPTCNRLHPSLSGPFRLGPFTNRFPVHHHSP